MCIIFETKLSCPHNKDCTANKCRNDLIMSSTLLSKLLCKNNNANSIQTWGRSTTATATKKKKKKKKKRLSGRLGPHINFDKLQKKNGRAGNFVWSDAVMFFVSLFTDKKTRVGGRGGVDTGSVGLVETRFVFFYVWSISTKDMWLGRSRTSDPWICSQTRSRR